MSRKALILKLTQLNLLFILIQKIQIPDSGYTNYKLYKSFIV